jgi:hypothetical protein
MAESLTLNLAAEQRDFLVNLFTEIVPEAQVWAYGSRVGGGGHPGSDLDLVLRLQSGAVPATTLAILRERIKTSELPILVDLHDWAALPVPFQTEISRRHVVLATGPESTLPKP